MLKRLLPRSLPTHLSSTLPLSFLPATSTTGARRRSFSSSLLDRRAAAEGPSIIEPITTSSGSSSTPTPPGEEEGTVEGGLPKAEHAVLSFVDLFSIGVGPSSSHTVGPMRAGAIFVNDLRELGLLDKITTLKITLHGSLAATGKGHMTPEAILMGLEGDEPDTIEPSTIQSRYATIRETKRLTLGGSHVIHYDGSRDMLWRMEALPAHPNGMRFAVFSEDGDLLATNTFYSVGGGFVVNERTQVDENMYFKSIDKHDVSSARLDQTHGLPNLPSLAPPETSRQSHPKETISGEDGKDHQEKPKKKEMGSQPPFMFHNAASLEALTKKHNLTIAQLVWNNELSYLTREEISYHLLNIWSVMDGCIRAGVTSTEEELPGLGVRRRSPGLYRRLFKGFYPSHTASAPSNPSIPSPATTTSSPSLVPPPSSTSNDLFASSSSLNGNIEANPNFFNLSRLPSAPPRPRLVGSFDHDLVPITSKSPVFPGIDFLSCYAIAVNEVNAGGGRVVTAPTNGAAGVIPAVCKYLLEFLSDEPDRDVKTFLLTASAIGMIVKRGATISAAEGGCMAEVGVASSMAAAGFTACMGGSPKQILQAAEIALEHSLGLTCDPIGGLVQVPCIERNSLGSVKAVTAAQLALAAGDGPHAVSFDEVVEAMRVTARDMSTAYKETSLGGLATSVRIPLSSPAC